MHSRRDDSKNIEGALRPSYPRRGARAGAPGRGRGGYAFSHQHMNSRDRHETANNVQHSAPSATIQRWHQDAPWAVQVGGQPQAYPPLAFGSVPAQNYATNVPPSFGFIPGGLTSNPTAYQRPYQQVIPAEDVEMGYAAQELEGRLTREPPRTHGGEHRRDDPPAEKGKWKGKGKQREYTPDPTDDDTRNAKWREERATGWRAPHERQQDWRSDTAGPSSSSSSSFRAGRQSRPAREFQITVRDDDINDPDYERKLLEEYRAIRQARIEEEENRKRVLELERTIRDASEELKKLKSKKHGRSPSEEQDTKRARTDERSMDERSSASYTTSSSRPRHGAQSPVAGPSYTKDRSGTPEAGASRPRYEQKRPEARAAGGEGYIPIVDYNRRPTFPGTVHLEEMGVPPREMVPRPETEVKQEVFDFPNVSYPRPDRRELIARTAPEGAAPSIEEIRRKNAEASEAQNSRPMEDQYDNSDYGEEEFDWRYETIADTDSPEERVAKKKHNKEVDSRVREQYDKERASYYRQQGRSILPQVEVNGETIRDNELGGLIIPRTFLHRPSNTILVGNRARDAIEAEERGETYSPPMRKGFPFPYGLPMTPREVREGVRIVLFNKKHPDFVEVRYLLCWFHRIATFLIPEFRDWAMWDVLAQFTEQAGLREINIDERTPPKLLHMPRLTGTNTAMGAAQPDPHAPLIDHMAYAILYQAPGTVNYPRGLVMAYNNYVYVPSVLAWLILRLTGPNGNSTAMREYTRHMVAITIIPGRFTDLINQWNEREPQHPLVQPTWRTSLYHLFVTRGQHNIDEFMVVRHLLHCGINQRMIDTMYAWGMQYAYTHAHSASNAFHLDHLRSIEAERVRRLAERGVPEPLEEYDGWWSVPRSGEFRLRYIIDEELWGQEHHRRTLPEGGNRFTQGRWFRVGVSPFRTEVFTPEPTTTQPQAAVSENVVEDVEMKTEEGGNTAQDVDKSKDGSKEADQQPSEAQTPMEVDTSNIAEEGELNATTEAGAAKQQATPKGPNRPDEGMVDAVQTNDPNRSEATAEAPANVASTEVDSIDVAPADIPLPPSSDDGEI